MAAINDSTKTQNARVMRGLPSEIDRRKTPRSEIFTEIGWRAVCDESRKHGSEGGQGVLRDRLSYPTVIGINTVSIGSLTASVVHPREVMKPAILSNAAALLGCHNHPSGAPQPSQEDRALL